MNFRVWLLLGFFSASLICDQWTLATSSAPVPVLMFMKSESGASTAVPLTSVALQNRLQTVIGTVRNSILPVLQTNQSAPGSGLELNTVSVGLTLGTGFGFGPIWNVTPSVGLRLVFTNNLNPIFPE